MRVAATKSTRVFLAFLLACALAVPVFAGERGMPVMVPLQEDAAGSASARGMDLKARKELKKGRVMLATDYFFPAARQGQGKASLRSFRGRTVSLSLFEGQEYRVVVDAESRRDDLVSVSGRLEGHDLSTFSLTVGPKSYILDLQDMQAGILYHVVGETESGVGTIQAVDANAAPPFTYSEPLYPPSGE